MPISTASFAMLWSPHQNAFSIETVGDMLANNLAVFANERKGDYIVLGSFDSLEEAREASNGMMQIRDSPTRSPLTEPQLSERCEVVDIESARTPRV